MALAVQAVLLASTLVVMVSQSAPEEPPVFEGEHSVGVENDSEPKQDRLRELQRRMSRPRTFQTLAVANPLSDDLPPAPVLPKDTFEPDLAEEVLWEESSTLLADSGLLDLAGSLGGKESAAEFFGVKDSGKRIVIVVNTSASVVRKAANRGVSIEQIQAEAAKLVEGLDSGTVFGIVQFSQGTRSFAEQLAPALKKNKAAAAEWVRAELKGNPKIEDERHLGHEAGMRAALLLRPDVVFVVTDGSLNRRVPSGSGYSYPRISFEQLVQSIEREMRENGAKPRIHVIGFELGDKEREGLRYLTRRFGGTLREM